MKFSVFNMSFEIINFWHPRLPGANELSYHKRSRFIENQTEHGGGSRSRRASCNFWIYMLGLFNFRIRVFLSLVHISYVFCIHIYYFMHCDHICDISAKTMIKAKYIVKYALFTQKWVILTMKWISNGCGNNHLLYSFAIYKWSSLEMEDMPTVSKKLLMSDHFLNIMEKPTWHGFILSPRGSLGIPQLTSFVQQYHMTHCSTCKPISFIQGPFSLSSQTSYRQISRNLKAVVYRFRIVWSFWNIQQTMLQRRLSNFRAIQSY